MPDWESAGALAAHAGLRIERVSGLAANLRDWL